MSQAHLTQQDESVSADGFMGQYWHAGTTTTPRPAVLVLDGLPGGMLDTSLAEAEYLFPARVHRWAPAGKLVGPRARGSSAQE